MSWTNKKSDSKNGEGGESYSFARWMSRLFLAVSALLLLFIYYRAEVVFQRVKDATYIKYALISFAGIIFWGCVLRLREGIQANIVTVAISLVVGLYLVEGAITFLGLGQFSDLVATSQLALARDVGYDQRTQLQVIEDLIDSGVEAVPALRPHIVLTMSKELLPLGGISGKTTVSSNESGRYMIYPSDRYGFNNPDSEWDAEEVEWLLTGDSFTEGMAVQPGEDIAGQLRVITQKSAISIGRGGNGPLMELAALIEYAGAVKPKKVLWIYFEGNDLKDDFQRDKGNLLLLQYMQDGFSQNLINRQKEIDSRLREYVLDAGVQPQLKAREAQMRAEMERHKTHWMRLGAIRKSIGFDRRGVDFGDDADCDVDHHLDDPLFAKILLKAKSKVATWGGTLYFVYLPEPIRYKIAIISHDRFRKKAKVIDFVKGLDIPVIDMHQKVFVGHSDPLSLFTSLSHHNTAEGYAEIAKIIAENIVD